jgi:hypothetical protein
MNWNDQDLAEAVRDARPPPVEPPPFESVIAAAERQYQLSRRRYAWFASAAAVTAAVYVAFSVGTPSMNEADYIHIADLLESTSWSAPSDVLMPTHQIDIYQELPTLTESTKPAEGALL